jgi:uncharacterized protein (DUF58 family)
MNNDTPGSTAGKTELHLNTRLLPGFVIACAVLYAWTGFRGWLAFAIGIGGAWLLAAWWVHALRRGLRVKRSIHMAWAGVGESVPEELVISNDSPFPAAWLEIVDESDDLQEPLRLISDVGAHSVRRRHPVHLFKRRGVYTLGPTRLRTGDPFGIYSLTLRAEEASTILVTPPIMQLQRLRIPHGGWAGDRRRVKAMLRRDTSDAGVRDYQPGDSLKRIHWRVSAHQDALMVRRAEASAAEDWWLCLDLEARVQAGAGRDTTLELAVVLAASLASRGIREGRRVGLALCGPRLTRLEARGGLMQQWRTLRALATAEAGNVSLQELLAASASTRSATRIVITPTSDTAWVAGLNQHRNNAIAFIVLIDPRDFGGNQDQTALRDALARGGLPYARMPGSLLKAAYETRTQGSQRGGSPADAGWRFLGGTGTTWQSMG